MRYRLVVVTEVTVTGVTTASYSASRSAGNSNPRGLVTNVGLPPLDVCCIDSDMMNNADVFPPI